MCIISVRLSPTLHWEVCVLYRSPHLVPWCVWRSVCLTPSLVMCLRSVITCNSLFSLYHVVLRDQTRAFRLGANSMWPLSLSPALRDPLSGIYCNVINEPQTYNRVSLDKERRRTILFGISGRGKGKKLAVKIFPKENAQDPEMRMAKGSSTWVTEDIENRKFCV